MFPWGDYLYYSPSDGTLRWKVRCGKRSRIDGISGSKSGNGYVQIRVKGNSGLAHRIIWELHHGPIPEGMEIDHINHVKDDNRIENLRLVDNPENGKNKSKFKRNTSGKTGVYYHKRDNVWIASIGTGKKLVHLGNFKEKADAIAARTDAEILYGFHENSGK